MTNPDNEPDHYKGAPIIFDSLEALTVFINYARGVYGNEIDKEPTLRESIEQEWDW